MTKIFTCGGYCAAAVDPLAIVALDEVAARVRLPRRARRRLCRRGGARAGPVQAACGRERLLAADLRHRREGRAGPALRRRAGRRDPRAPERQAPRRRRSSTSAASSPRAASRDCSGWRSIRRTRRCASSTCSTRPATARRRSSSTGRTGRAPPTPRLLFSSRDPYGNHNGGMLAFGRNGRLHFTMGDGGSGGDPENRSQNMRSLFGKLLSINVATKGLKIEALGLRNAWRFSFDRANGDLYLGDVGQGAVEEIDWSPNGSPGLENYGWDVYEGPLEVRGQGARPRQARRSRSRSTATTTAARSRAATSTAARTRRCAGATSTATTAAGTSGASSSRAARPPASGAKPSRSTA